MIANAVSKILGAIFKIPLTYIIGEEGMAVYNTAFSIYIMFLSFIISGLPFAVSKLVSEYSAKKQPSMVGYTVRLSNVILLLVGLAGSAVLYFGAEFFALALKEEKAVFAVKMIAPSVFFVAAGTAVRSYFQGVSNMIPTAVSQVIEAVIKLAAGYILAARLLGGGISAAAGGAVMGVTIGEAAATAVFLAVFVFSGKIPDRCRPEEKRIIHSELAAIALPLLFASVLSAMLSAVDTAVVRSGLLISEADADSARRIYGAYTGYALTLLHLPAGILATLGVSLLPVIAGGLASGNHVCASAAAVTAVRLTVIFAVPCTVIMLTMSKELLEILFGNSSSAYMLSMSAPCIVMICVSNILISVMQSGGKIMNTVAYSTIGMAIRLIMSAVLIRDIGIYGAVISANVSSLAVMLLCAAGTKKFMGLKFGIKETIIKPAFAGMAMYAVIYLAKEPICMKIPGIFPSAAAVCVLSAIVYVLSLALTGSEEIKHLILMRKSLKTIEKS